MPESQTERKLDKNEWKYHNALFILFSPKKILIMPA